ncbi:hypothetical protein AAKU67_004491 [Oxalobacteraceae bacterium GrIS 2.11]
MLSEFGVISQIPISLITVATTGASGTFKTRYGNIEFTHVDRTTENIMASTLVMDARPLRVARKREAYRDLVAVGRNLGMVDMDELNDDDE